jgi:NAD(P) transhydrogenase subunit alpha
VAGLQAIATAKRLGARVSAYDVRAEVREQVESLGAQFIELDLDVAGMQTAGGYARDQSVEFLRRQREQLGSVLADADVVITAALVAGARAPTLVTDEMLARMRPGSVLIDLAAAKGGNCAASVPGETIDRNGVAVIGLSNAESQLAAHASQMYSRNLARFLVLLAECGDDPSKDEILVESMVAADGSVRNRMVLDQLSPPPGDGNSNA